MNTQQLTKFGTILIALGVVGFIVAVIMSLTAYSGVDQGAIPAASFLAILLGFSLANPSMLQDPNGGLSTMRITVFAIVLLFCTIYLKLGWSIGKFETLTIDKTWIYILGLAFGSKVFQKFGEDTPSSSNGGAQVKKQTTVEQTEEVKLKGPDGGKDTSNDVLQ